MIRKDYSSIDSITESLKLIKDSVYLKEMAQNNAVDINPIEYRNYIVDYMSLLFIGDKVGEILGGSNKVDEFAIIYDFPKWKYGISLSYKSEELGDVQSEHWLKIMSPLVKFKQCEPLRRISLNNPFGVEETNIGEELVFLLNKVRDFLSVNNGALSKSLGLNERTSYSVKLPVLIVRRAESGNFETFENVSYEMSDSKYKIYLGVLENYTVLKEAILLENDVIKKDLSQANKMRI